MKRFEFLSKSPADTRGFAADMIKEFGDDAVFGLYGELGSGKTCFVQGLAAALGINDVISSPTFKIVSEYMGKVPLYHMDLYRISSPHDVFSFDLEWYLEARGVKALEWAGRVGNLLPDNAVKVFFEGVACDSNLRSIKVNK